MGTTSPEVTEFKAGGHPVLIGPGALLSLQEHLSELEASALFILGDHNTLRHCLPELLAHVPLLRDAGTIAVEPGEGSKSLEV